MRGVGRIDICGISIIGKLPFFGSIVFVLLFGFRVTEIGYFNFQSTNGILTIHLIYLHILYLLLLLISHPYWYYSTYNFIQCNTTFSFNYLYLNQHAFTLPLIRRNWTLNRRLPKKFHIIKIFLLPSLFLMFSSLINKNQWHQILQRK